MRNYYKERERESEREREREKERGCTIRLHKCHLRVRKIYVRSFQKRFYSRERIRGIGVS